MTELTIKLIILLIPGAIATLIYSKLILHKKWDNFNFVLISIIFGLFSYLTLQLLIDILNLFFNNYFNNLSIWDELNNTRIIPYSEMFKATIISIFLSYVFSYIENNKIINRIAKHYKVSNKYGEENLYSRFLNSKEVEYVYIRDIKNNLTYYGWVKSFSESDSFSEICLADVEVYKYEDSTLLYEIPQIYLSFNKQEIIIELAKPKKE